MDTGNLKRAYSIVLSVVLIGILLCLSNVFFPLKAFAKDSSTSSQSNLDMTMSQDVYFKVEGPVSGPPAPKLSPEDYRSTGLPGPFGESRIIIWTLAQQHRYFAALFLGGLFWIMVLELGSLITRNENKFNRYNFLAREILDIVVLVYSMTAILGVIFLFGLIALYPDFTKYLIGLFRPFFMVYGLLFLFLSTGLYIYYYTWRRTFAGFPNWIHASLGMLINFLGITMMMIANSWGTFMMSPSGVDNQGQYLGNVWAVLHNALWNPFNVHRFCGNLIFAAAVIGAYAAYYSLKLKSPEEKSYYDWIGGLALIGVVFALFTFPFGGYWLLREIYSYRQQMGITLLGGLLAWLGIILVFLIGILFFGINYYIWQRINSVEGGLQYHRYAKYIFFILAVCVLAYATPHTLVMQAQELKAIGGQQHPVIGNFGVESTKNPAINIVMIATIFSLFIWWRVQYQIPKSPFSLGDGLYPWLFLVGGINVIWLGVYGYYIPANARVGLSVPIVMTTFNILVFGSILTYLKIYRAERITTPKWGNLSIRGHYILFFIAITITWIMALGGYRRSSVRLFWHSTEIFRDTSPWAFTHTIGFVGNVISINTLLFWFFLLLILWVKKIGEFQGENKIITVDQKVGQQSGVGV